MLCALSRYCKNLHVMERRITMTMIDAVLFNGSQYIVLVGLLALAWASLQRKNA